MRGRCTQPGDIRIKSAFLLLPKCIKDEWRWLEYASWKEKYKCNWVEGCGWISLEWINNG